MKTMDSYMGEYVTVVPNQTFDGYCWRLNSGLELPLEAIEEIINLYNKISPTKGDDGILEETTALVLSFGGNAAYEVKRRFHKNNDTTFTCTCPDFVYRKKDLGQYCKHIDYAINNNSFLFARKYTTSAL